MATIWVFIAMAAAIFIGVVGLGMTKAGALESLEGSASETVIVKIAGLISSHGVFPAVIAGVILAGIMAATMSTADSQMLAAASSVSQNILQDFLHIKMDGKKSLGSSQNYHSCRQCHCCISGKGPGQQCFRNCILRLGRIWRCLWRGDALRAVLEAL